MNAKELLGMLADRIADLEKERDALKVRESVLLDGAEKYQSRIAELTRPREVDEALVEELREKVSLALRYWPAHETVRAILSALPPLVQPPVELTDQECDRLYNEYAGVITSSKHRCWPEDRREAVRALLAAAGRYVQPVSAGPATDDELWNTAKPGIQCGECTTASLRAVYDLGRSHGQPRRITREELEKACQAHYEADGNGDWDGHGTFLHQPRKEMTAALQALGFEVEGAEAPKRCGMRCDQDAGDHAKDCRYATPSDEERVRKEMGLWVEPVSASDVPPRRLTQDELTVIEECFRQMRPGAERQALRILANALAPKTEGT